MTPRTAKPMSFNSFFRIRLLPVLREFERTRRKRLPFLLALLVLFLVGIAVALGLLFPVFRHVIPVFMGGWGLLFLCVLLLRRFIMPRSAAKHNEGGLPYRGSAPAHTSLRPLRPVFGLVTYLDNLVFANGRRRMRFSAEVLAKTAEFTVPGLVHRPAEYVGQGDFIESMLYGARINGYAGRDFFHGSLGRAGLAFSWIRSTYRVSAKGGEKNQRLLFTGWFFVVTFKRRFAGATIIHPDLAEAKIGWLGRSIQEFSVPPYLELVLLEDVEFEQRFKVMTTSQLAVRYILSPRFMRLATAVHKRLGGHMALSFHGDRMYAAFPSVGEYFNQLPTRPFTDPGYLRHFYHAMKGVADMAEEIGKYQKLWQNDVIHFPLG